MANLALFAAITHKETDNFYFVFYSESLDTMWIMTSKEFLSECATNKNGKNTGKHTIWFNGCKKNPQTGQKEAYCHKRLNKYIRKDFSDFH